MWTVLLFAGAAAIQAQAFNPAAGELFEREPELKAWALRLYDRNRDGWLTLYEAQAALLAFEDFADANRDGRVMLREFEEAKRFVQARYGPSELPPVRAAEASPPASSP